MINSFITFTISSFEAIIVYFLIISINRDNKLNLLRIIALILIVSSIATLTDFFGIKTYYIISVIQYTVAFIILKFSNKEQLIYDCPVAMLLLTSAQHFITIIMVLLQIDISKNIILLFAILIILLGLSVYTSISTKILVIVNRYYRPNKLLIFFVALGANLLLSMISIIFYDLPHIYFGEAYYLSILSVGYFIVSIVSIVLVIRLKLQKDKINIWSDFAENVAGENLTQRKEIHDFHSHLDAIQVIADSEPSGDMIKIGIKNYISELRDNANKSNSKLPLAEDNFLSAYLLSVQNKMTMEKINFRYSIIKSISEFGFTQNELIVLLSNLINNAKDAVLKLDDKDRKINLVFDSDRFVISNTVEKIFDPSTIVNFRTPGYSTKKIPQGTGLTNVEELIEKKGMVLTLDYNQGMFVAEIRY